MIKKSCALVGLLFLYSCSGGGAYVDQGAPYHGRGNYYYDDDYYYRHYHHHRHDGKHHGKHRGHGGGKHGKRDH